MPSITALFRSLGNDGAVANVGAVLAARQQEDWLVAGLCRRISDRELPSLVRPDQPPLADTA